MPTRIQTEIAPDGAPRDESDLRYRVEAVTRAVRLIRELRDGPPGNAEDLASAAEIPPAFAQVALETLARHGLVRQLDVAAATPPDAPSGPWGLGLTWLRLADARRRQTDLRELALPIMRRIRDDVDETVILCVRRGNRRVNIDYVESTQAIRRVTQHGYETALHIGAAGRALMCGLSNDELGDYFADLASTSGRAGRLHDVPQFMADLDGVRQKGFAQARGEMTADTAAVSAPVFDHMGNIVAAVTISCPGDRFTPGLGAACVAAVRSGAGELSRLLGFSPARRDPS